MTAEPNQVFKRIKWIAILGVLILGSIGIYWSLSQPATERSSPITNTRLEWDNKAIEVIYSSPSKKGRTIFGELVPYGEVWRTGANEATVFQTSVALTIQGKNLPAGTYTLWTIPQKDRWTVIWNKKMYPWGVDFNAKAMRNAQYDALLIEVPTKTIEPEEQFAIQLSGENGRGLMRLSWDKVKVEVDFIFPN